MNSLYQLQKATGKTKYFTFEMSVWNIEGKVVAFLSAREEEIKAFDRREINLSETQGRLPASFFDIEAKLLEYEYRKADFIGEVGDEDERLEWTDELLDLFGLREINHNLIFSTEMTSVKESDYYNHRDCFPADWEDCFTVKDYYFCIQNDVGLRGKNEDGTEFVYKDGYWLIHSISALDAQQFYEKVICMNTGYGRDYSWECGMLGLDCDFLFRGPTQEELANDPATARKFAEYTEKYITGKTCFGEVNIEDFGY